MPAMMAAMAKKPPMPATDPNKPPGADDFEIDEETLKVPIFLI